MSKKNTKQVTKRQTSRKKPQKTSDLIFDEEITENKISIEKLIRKVFDLNDKDFINELVQLQFLNGKKVFENDPSIYLEVSKLLETKSFTETISILKQSESEEEFIWNLDSLVESKNNLYREISLALKKEQGSKGAGKCRFCSSKELVFISKQTRSSDEPATIFVKCVLCKKTWTE
jgi:DNA-directed RNA polymerase subunit M/transcription elongation factor TFIIS